MSTHAEALAEGLEHQKAGRLEEAARIYADALRRDPDDIDALHLSGMLALQQGQARVAEQRIRRAIGLAPRVAMFHVSLATVLRSAGRIEEAIHSYRRALELDPSDAFAAVNLGMALQSQRRWAEACAAYRQALQARPDWAEAHALLASALAALRRWTDAAGHSRRAIELRPDLAEAHNILGVALEAEGRFEEALACYEHALALRPEFPEALNNRGNVLAALGRIEPAEADYRSALALAPRYAPAWNNLGHALEMQGAVKEALECYRRAIELDDALEVAHSNLLLALHYDPDATPAEIYTEHRRWAARLKNLAARGRAHDNDPDPDRRLRIGYLSPDFRRHSVAYFLEPVLAHHDRTAFEIIAYSNTAREDSVTERLRALCDGWRCIRGLDDEAAAELIRRDGVDILVDLAGHTAGGRPLVAARKPAPVQVNWLGYPDTTGLEAVDYRLTDEHADPPGKPDAYASERLVRLPAPFLCYLPPREAPPVTPRPDSSAGRIRFGAFHNLAKINASVAEAWARILAALPEAELVVKSRVLEDPAARRRLTALLERAGISERRFKLRGAAADLRAHLAAIAEVDVALDAFPYAGTTTTCEALWMGVPVVTLAGDRHAARTGATLLAAVGLSDLVAHSTEEYIACAVRLARHPGRLAELRATLRERMAASRLTDGGAFTRTLEAAFRRMWRRWAEGRRR